MSRIFLSHSSENNAEALSLSEWLKAEGWDDVFLDLDPERGIKSGERWEEALRDAAGRCEAVLFLVSRAWLNSEWCRDEFRLVRHLRKRLFGLLIEDIAPADLPAVMTREWQFVSLAVVGETRTFSVLPPQSAQPVDIRFAVDGLHRLKVGLQAARLDARHFAWPPETEPKRAPYPGLRPLEPEDAGIFFGRDAPIVEALDTLRGLRDAPAPRLLVILGASGAGKSSFLRAGLFPRLSRDDQAFLPLPIIRPERAALTGETGLLRALETACAAARITIARADLRKAILGGGITLKPLLQSLVDATRSNALEGDGRQRAPCLVLSIDQGEELFLAEGQAEAPPFLALLRDLLIDDAPAVITVFTIRSDNYERLQLAKELDGIQQRTLSLPPVPKGAYAEVIKGPARRLLGTSRAFKMEDRLVDELLVDIEAGGATDALPLLAFTLERLYLEYHAASELKLSNYNDLGRIKGSIEAAVDQAFKAADADPSIPGDRADRLALLRPSIIPWLAGIDADTGAPRRRVARLSEIPANARPLIQHFVDQRLLATDVAKDTGEGTIEPAHEALLRQWGLLQGWLAEDAGLLSVIDGVKRASRDWAANGKAETWLTHTTGRLDAAERLGERPDLAANLAQADLDYISSCRRKETADLEHKRAAARNRQRMLAMVIFLLVGVTGGVLAWLNQGYLNEQYTWFAVARPYMMNSVRPYVLDAVAERALKPGQTFRECATDCPEMLVIPSGSFIMGSPDNEADRSSDEGPLRGVTIAKPFAISTSPVTFAEWDACVAVGGCLDVTDSGFGRGNRPVINVNWEDARQYAAWLTRMTGKPYRLLSELEWEYAARAGASTRYFWGDEIGKGNANCIGCGSKWDGRMTSPVGSFKPNPFGVYDAHGNVWQWVEDCHHDRYDGAPTDGSAWIENCERGRRAVRGGGWDSYDYNIRAANRDRISIGSRINDLGIRVARSLNTAGDVAAP